MTEEITGEEGGLVEALAERLGRRSSVELAFGGPVERDGVTVMPVAQVRYGFGGGSGAGGAGVQRGSGSGGGGGLKVRPIGFVRLAGGHAEFVPVTDPVERARALVAAALAGWLLVRTLGRLLR